jgi:hypothetical protein
MKMSSSEKGEKGDEATQKFSEGMSSGAVDLPGRVIQGEDP